MTAVPRAGSPPTREVSIASTATCGPPCTVSAGTTTRLGPLSERGAAAGTNPRDARTRSGEPMRHTKIVATIGPASDSPEVLDAMLAAGVDVARLNASHGDPDSLERRLHAIRDAAGRAGREVAVMLDLG